MAAHETLGREFWVAQAGGPEGCYELLHVAAGGLNRVVAAGLSGRDATFLAHAANAELAASKSGPLLQRAIGWLSNLLASGPKRLKQVRYEAELTGLCSAKTLYRVKNIIGVEEFGSWGNRWWRLPSATYQVGDEPST